MDLPGIFRIIEKSDLSVIEIEWIKVLVEKRVNIGKLEEEWEEHHKAGIKSKASPNISSDSRFKQIFSKQSGLFENKEK